MSGWIVGGIAAVPIVVLVLAAWSRVRFYRRLFADEHVLEVARAAAGVKAAAAQRVIVDDDDVPASPRDPRTLLTRAGLAFIYTVSKQASGFVHHCSVSVAGGYTPHAVGRTFVVLFAKLIGLPIEKACFMIGTSTVHHAEATLGEAEHADLIGTAVLEITEGNVAEVRRAISELNDRVTWNRVAPPPR